ncbi:MAG: YbjN domain-containing protein [Pseudomonadota bacterium]
MRVLLTVFAAASLALAPLGVASAESVSKKQIADILANQGYPVRDFDRNMVAVVVSDHVVLVGVDGADGDVTYLTFLSGVSGSTLSFDFLNKFNNEVKFGRAYVDRDGDVAIQMDRNAAGGVSAENIESDFDVFLLLISKFLSDLESQTIA